jgi:hypothetical protein
LVRGSRLRTAIGLSGAVAVAGLLGASSAQARHLDVHVNIKDPSGYRMSIEASRSSRHVFAIAHRKVAGPSEPAPLGAFTRRQATQVTRLAKDGRSGHRASSGFLSVQVENGHAISTYGVNGTVTHNRLYGKLGDFGRISLHFHLHRTRTHRGGCLRTHERIGTFSGRMHFRGENGYVDVDAQRMRGTVELPATHSRCVLISVPPPRIHHGSRSKASQQSRHHRYTILYAHAKSEPTLFASLKESRESSVFAAATFGEQGPVFVYREAYLEGKASDFRVNRRVTSAHIDPSPNAFRGSGNFKAPHRWRGPLATSFPGAPNVRLAGRDFRAELERLDLSRYD